MPVKEKKDPDSRRMKKTFECNESMIITIPIGNLKDAGAGQLMPEKFHCVFRDSFKVFVVNGKPKPLGAAQALAGLFLCILGLIVPGTHRFSMIYSLPSALFVVSGLLSYAAGKAPQMHVAKLSFSLNIISFFWSVAAFYFCIIEFTTSASSVHVSMFNGVIGLKISLLVVENFVTLFLIYWLSKAICRQHFNTLPIILLKQTD